MNQSYFLYVLLGLVSLLAATALGLFGPSDVKSAGARRFIALPRSPVD